MEKRLPLLLILPALLGGCGTANTSVYPQSGTVLPNVAAHLTPTTTVTFEQALLAGAVIGAAYLVYDPLAPNWTIEEKRVNDETYYLSLRAKSFRIGGDGEAYQIFKRRAALLQRERGFTGYRILDYSQGVDSGTPTTHLFGEGTIQLVRAGETAKR